MYFPKQHYDSIVPEKPGINKFSASYDIDLFSSTRNLITKCPIYSHLIFIDVTTCWGK